MNTVPDALLWIVFVCVVMVAIWLLCIIAKAVFNFIFPKHGVKARKKILNAYLTAFPELKKWQQSVGRYKGGRNAR